LHFKGNYEIFLNLITEDDKFLDIKLNDIIFKIFQSNSKAVFYRRGQKYNHNRMKNIFQKSIQVILNRLRGPEVCVPIILLKRLMQI